MQHPISDHYDHPDEIDIEIEIDIHEECECKDLLPNCKKLTPEHWNTTTGLDLECCPECLSRMCHPDYFGKVCEKTCNPNCCSE